jgi:hypothetical protein
MHADEVKNRGFGLPQKLFIRLYLRASADESLVSSLYVRKLTVDLLLR